MNERGLDRDAFVKVFSCFKDVIKNAQLIEAHDDIYKFTPREDPQFEKAYAFISAFQDDENVYPVELLIKNFHDKDGVLHIAITLAEIKKTGIMPSSQLGVDYESTPVTYNLTDLIKFVNDGNFLMYIPNELLDEKQKLLKYQTTEKERVRINNIVDKAYFDTLSNNNTKRLEQLVKNEALRNGYDDSYDLIEYDDNGTVIPLSERFNDSNNDIRFAYNPNNKTSFADPTSDKVTTKEVKEAVDRKEMDIAIDMMGLNDPTYWESLDQTIDQMGFRVV